jgi:tRNA A-37 threonylcarbamoyl transferase component Bud32
VLEEHMEAFNEFENKSKQQKVIKDRRQKRTVEYAAGGKTYLVKMYKVDTLGQKIATALAGSKARKEFEVSLELQRRGIPAVRIVAMKDSGDRRWIACEKLDGGEQLQAVLLSEATPPARRRRLCFEYGKFARHLQESGVWQYDFNPTNVLVRDPEMLLIDFERVRVRGRALPAEERMYLLSKMNRLRGVSRTDRWRFLKGYLAAHALEAKQPKLVAREILRRGAIQSEADADRSEERCVSENRDFGPFEFGDVAGYYLKARPEDRASGLTVDEVRTLAEAKTANGSYREEAVEEAIEGWKQANRRSREGGASPVAVLLKRGERRGRIVYRV